MDIVVAMAEGLQANWDNLLDTSFEFAAEEKVTGQIGRTAGAYS